MRTLAEITSKYELKILPKIALVEDKKNNDSKSQEQSSEPVIEQMVEEKQYKILSYFNSFPPLADVELENRIIHIFLSPSPPQSLKELSEILKEPQEVLMKFLITRELCASDEEINYYENRVIYYNTSVCT